MISIISIHTHHKIMYKELSWFIKILCKTFESDQREVNRENLC